MWPVVADRVVYKSDYYSPSVSILLFLNIGVYGGGAVCV